MIWSRRESRCARGAAALALLALAGCAAPPPPLFESKEHKFRARFGSPPAVIDQPDGDTPTQLFTVKSAAGAYTVRAYELPVPADRAAAAAPQLLAEAQADLIRAVGGVRTSSESISLVGKYPGRAFTAAVPEPRPGLLRGRVFVAGRRLYKVTVFGTAEFAEAPAATEFLQSFTVTE